MSTLSSHTWFSWFVWSWVCLSFLTVWVRWSFFWGRIVVCTNWVLFKVVFRSRYLSLPELWVCFYLVPSRLSPRSAVLPRCWACSMSSLPECRWFCLILLYGLEGFWARHRDGVFHHRLWAPICPNLCRILAGWSLWCIAAILQYAVIYRRGWNHSSSFRIATVRVELRRRPCCCLVLTAVWLMRWWWS